MAVLLCGSYAGRLTVYEGGFCAFAYDPSYDGPDMSVRMPARDATYTDEVIRPWVEGLLPDNKDVRTSMARDANCSADNPFDLLEAYGRDCPGAVQICTPDDVASVLAQEGSYEPITEREIGRRLRRAQSATAPSWLDNDERWSLGGAQGKISLARMGGHWNTCYGSAATTHLLKPGVEGFALQSLNEYLCMRLARACDLQVASASYEEFDGVPAIVIERYDREVLHNEGVRRLHQEDLCQALGFLPKDKYKPTPAQVLGLLRLDESGQSTYDFVSGLFFNYLVGATDAHAKNYSLMHLAEHDFFLAPLYDIASILPYEKKKAGPRVAAMPIGKEKRFGRLTGSNLERFARNNGLDPAGCIKLMESLALNVQEQVGRVVHSNLHIEGVGVIGPQFERTIRANCMAMLLNLHASGATCDTSMSRQINSGTIPRQ